MLGYADFKAQNLRWYGQQMWAVHDWDSLARQPRGGAGRSGRWVLHQAGAPTLAPSKLRSDAFLLVLMPHNESGSMR